MKKSLRFGGLIVLVLAVTGCESKPRANYASLNLVNVSGRITLDGQALAAAVVTFDDPTDGTFSYGLTDASGRYSLQIDSDMKGVKPGAKVVRVSTTRKILGLNTKDDGDPATAEPQSERVPERFNKKSKEFVEVTPDRTTYDFDLKSE